MLNGHAACILVESAVHVCVLMCTFCFTYYNYYTIILLYYYTIILLYYYSIILLYYSYSYSYSYSYYYYYY
jgi:hypothetical protein